MSNVAFTAEVKRRRPQPYSGPMCTRVQCLKAAKTLVLINKPYMLDPIKWAKKETVNLERKKTKAGRENMDRAWRWAQRCPWPPTPMCGNEATLPVAPIAPNLSVITGTGSSNHFSQTIFFSNCFINFSLFWSLGPII